MSDCGTGHFIEFDDPLQLKWRSGLPEGKGRYCIGRGLIAGRTTLPAHFIVTLDATCLKIDVARRSLED